MKKALYSTTAAVLFLFTLSGCADTAPVWIEDHPPQPTVEITLALSTEPTGPVESETISFSAGNAPLAQDSAANEGKQDQAKLELPAEPSPTPAPQMTQAPPSGPSTSPALQNTPEPVPQETPPPAKGTIKFDVTTQKGAGESPTPAPQRDPGTHFDPCPARGNPAARIG